MLIFSSDTRLTPAMMATHQRHEFTVPKGAKRVVAEMTYHPQVETDAARLREEAVPLLMKAFAECPLLPDAQEALDRYIAGLKTATNLITLSLDAPDGFAGASHRKENPIRVSVGEEDATPGYAPRTIAPGVWAVWLHMHSVCSPDVRVELRVSAETEGEA